MRDEIRKKIEENIHCFDLCALIKLLEAHRIDRKNIYFECSTNQSSSNNLCQKIIFDETSSHVTLILNIGLFTASSLLPSYIHRMIDTEEINSDAFNRFLNFFNHHMMDSFLQATLPESDTSLFSNWRQTKIHYLSLLGFESISTLSFLMKICFPDLVVEVKKNPKVMSLHSSSLVLGKDQLGYSAFLGNRMQETLSSFKIIFSTDHELSQQRIPWPLEITKRMSELVFPILKKTDLHLSVELRIKNKSNYLTLDKSSYLGFDRMWKSSHPLNICLFFGLIKNFKPMRHP